MKFTNLTKRLLGAVLIFSIFLTLSACTQAADTSAQSKASSEQTQSELHLGIFSYDDDCRKYQNDWSSLKEIFVNTEKTEIKDFKQAVEHAKNECVVEYDTIDVAYDATAEIYRVCFYKYEYLGGDQSVYLGKDGITQMMVFGE